MGFSMQWMAKSAKAMECQVACQSLQSKGYNVIISGGCDGWPFKDDVLSWLLR